MYRTKLLAVIVSDRISISINKHYSLHSHKQNFKGNSGTSLRQKEEFQLFGNNDNDRTTINRPQETVSAFTKYFERGYVVLNLSHNVNFADEVTDFRYIQRFFTFFYTFYTIFLYLRY